MAQETKRCEELLEQKAAIVCQNVVHKQYLHYAARLIEYFEVGRADTLKEAVNLLEAELRQEEYDRELRAHHQAVQNQMELQTDILAGVHDQTARAANAAESGAAWSAAGAIIMASEVERQRKKDRNGL